MSRLQYPSRQIPLPAPYTALRPQPPVSCKISLSGHVSLTAFFSNPYVSPSAFALLLLLCCLYSAVLTPLPLLYCFYPAPFTLLLLPRCTYSAPFSFSSILFKTPLGELRTTFMGSSTIFFPLKRSLPEISMSADMSTTSAPATSSAVSSHSVPMLPCVSV